MYKYIFCLLLLALPSCSIFVPPLTKVVDAPVEGMIILEAVDSFIYKWESVFHEDISRQIAGITIRFQPKTEEAWFKYQCVRGQTDPYNYQHITVRYRSEVPFNLAQTTLWHELTHIVFGKKYKDGDANHSELPGPWTKKNDQLISQLKKEYISKALFNMVTKDFRYVFAPL